MSSAITEVPGTWPTSVVAPDGTDVVSITALRSAMEDINDRVLRTRQSLGMAIVAGAGTSTTRQWDPSQAVVGTLGSGEHYFSASGVYHAIRQTAFSANGFCHVPLNAQMIPHGATITACTATLIGAGGHANAPAGPPDVSLYRRSSDGTYTLVGTQADPSASGAAYDASHVVTLSGLSEVINHATYTYSVMISGESSTDAANNLQCTGGSITYTPPV